MKKRILATILCVLMLVPCFTWVAFAGEGEVSPWNVTSTNVAPKGKTYQTSNWNADSSARYLNNGQLWSSWQFWRPGDVARGTGFEGIDNTRQHAGMSFNQYQTINEVTVYGHKYPDWNGAFCPKCYKEITANDYVVKYDDEGKVKSNDCKVCKTDVFLTKDEKNNIKYTVEILVQGQWYVAGHGYNNDMEYVIKNDKILGGTGGNIGAVTIKLDPVFPQYDANGDVVVDENGEPILTNWATTKNVRVVCSEYGAYALKGPTNEISFAYDSTGEITNITHLGKSYSVTRDEESSDKKYDSTYKYNYTLDVIGEQKSDYTISFSIKDSFGAAGFKIVQVEKEEPITVEVTDAATGKKVKKYAYFEDGTVMTQMVTYERYFFEYNADGTVKITQKLASTHDWWIVPLIHEIEIWGHQAVYTPKFDVPEGAEVVTDAALGGMAGATTSQTQYYPLLGNDRNSGTYWRAGDYENQSYWIDFEGAYMVEEIKLNFGGLAAAYDNATLSYDVYVMRGGSWQKIASDTVTATSALWEAGDLKVYPTGDGGRIEQVKVTFTSSKDANGDDIPPVITEVSAPIINGEQVVFLSSYLNYHRASSTAQGNLACYGEAYCSSSFDYSNISDVTYINDGQVMDDSYSWYAETFAAGSYCGVKLKDTEDVTKVVLYFNDQIVQGAPQDHVLSYDVQVLVDGVYKTVASGTSYNPETKQAIVSIEFDAVRTNDVRIVYKSNGMVFPYLKELEVYSGQKRYSSFDGFVLDLSIRTLYGKAVTKTFAEPSYVKRAKFMDLKSPIEFLVFATKYGLE